MDGKYTFNEFCNNLDEGYQIYYTYVRNMYLLYIFIVSIISSYLVRYSFIYIIKNLYVIFFV